MNTFVYLLLGGGKIESRRRLGVWEYGSLRRKYCVLVEGLHGGTLFILFLLIVCSFCVHKIYK